jgi:hypothetical protein
MFRQLLQQLCQVMHAQQIILESNQHVQSLGDDELHVHNCHPEPLHRQPVVYDLNSSSQVTFMWGHISFLFQIGVGLHIKNYSPSYIWICLHHLFDSF